MLVTLARYRTVTLDTSSGESEVTGALIDAQALLEEDLGGRPLEEDERVERMYPDGTGRLYPIVTPIVAGPSGYVIDGASFLAASPFPGPFDFINPVAYVDVTYTAGYVERTANPSAANRLPQHVEIDLCWAAYRALNPSGLAVAVPANASSVALGDASLAFSGGSPPPQGADFQAGWSSATWRLRRRRI